VFENCFLTDGIVWPNNNWFYHTRFGEWNQAEKFRD